MRCPIKSHKFVQSLNRTKLKESTLLSYTIAYVNMERFYKSQHRILKSLLGSCLARKSDIAIMSAASQWHPSLLDELLPIYYKKLFPFSHYYKWLRYKDSGPSYFKNREFSFTLKDDIYLRYRSYSDQAELEKDLRTRCPHKIDIGAVFTCSVSSSSVSLCSLPLTSSFMSWLAIKHAK